MASSLSTPPPEEVRRLLPRLHDSTFTRILIVTLPEATPVLENGMKLLEMTNIVFSTGDKTILS